MTRHDQHSIPKNTVCAHCQNNCCNECVDIVRIALGLPGTLCNCKRDKHSVEPSSQQILDPITEAVHAPGLIVQQDGTVEIRI